MSAGIHTVTFYANDSAGNMNSTSLSFTVTAVGFCQNLNAPLNYVLISDVSAETCFTIVANNITLDGQGHKITYSNTISGYAINSNGYNFTTIKNLNITQGSSAGSSYAIRFNGAINSTIINNTITTSGISSDGIHLQLSSTLNIYRIT